MIKRIHIGCGLLGIALSLFTLDFPIVGGITTNRLAFLFILLGFLTLYAGRVRYHEILAMNKFMRTYRVIILFSVFATLLSSFYYQEDLSVLIGWMFTYSSILIMFMIINNESYKELILKYAIFSFILFLFVLVVHSIVLFGFLASQSFGLRYYMNTLGPGLSRIVTGVICGNVFVVLCYVKSKHIIKYIVPVIIFSLVLSMWFVFSSHSRQGILNLLIITMAFLLKIYLNSKNKAVLLIAMVSLVVLGLGKLFESEVFQDRFITRTQSQLEDGEGSTADRIHFYQEGIRLFSENMIVGIGPKKYSTIVGMDAHSGYILEVSETGLFTFIGIIIFFLLMARYIIEGGFSLTTIPYSLLMLTLVLVPFFKSIYNSPMLWCTLLLVIHEYIIHKFNKENA